MSRVFDVEVRMRRHARLLGDVLGMTAWFAAHGRTSISDGSGLVAEFEQNSREMYDQMARIAITPHWVRYYDFGAGRMPRFLQELAEQNES